jgi:hypothetical protein
MAGFAITKLLVALAATLVCYGVYRLFKVVYEELTSLIRDLPGPKNRSLLHGHMKEIQKDVRSSYLPCTNLLPTLAQ